MGILYPDHPLDQGHPLDAYCVALTNARTRNDFSSRESRAHYGEKQRARADRSLARSSDTFADLEHDKKHSVVQADDPTQVGPFGRNEAFDTHSAPEQRRHRRRLSARERQAEYSVPSSKRGRANRPRVSSGYGQESKENTRVIGPRKLTPGVSKTPYNINNQSVPTQSEIDYPTRPATEDSALDEHRARETFDSRDNDGILANKENRYDGKRASVAASEYSYSHPSDHAPPPRAHHPPRRSASRVCQERHHSSADESSLWDEVEFYKYGHMPTDMNAAERRCCCAWSRRSKWIVLGLAVATIVLIVIIVLAVTLTRKNYTFTASQAHVTNPQAFASGGATHRSSDDVQDGLNSARDEYTYYTGDASNFPPQSEWISFEHMWEANLDSIQNSCGWLHEGSNNSPAVVADIYSAIQDRANASLVDHRFILATVLQESSGCVLAGQTVSSGGVTNPGLMQSHDGHEFDAAHSKLSILWMIQDGTQGPHSGDGLVQYLNRYGDPYEAARGYNSGHIPSDGNLSEAAGATACYVSDIANRLTGWVTAKSTCPGDTV